MQTIVHAILGGVRAPYLGHDDHVAFLLVVLEFLLRKGILERTL